MAEVESSSKPKGLPAMKRTMSLARAISENHHRRFPTVADYVAVLGGEKGIVIEKVLIANNGVAAVKAIRSIRRWAYEVFGNERAVSFVVMATPEDLRANAEYIRMGDVIVDVPGGSNNHNYANVTLIVELARLHGVHAVWAGWGHASENPLLPDSLAQSNPPIKFIGPSGPPMRALGDKIGSTIIAQSAGVPCIAWNGGNVFAQYDRQTGTLPEEAYEQASIASATEASEAAERIGFPIMIKASEGGGGKGIRMVDTAANVQTAYRQVCGEVPGSPIFIMKLSTKSRHLEVQLLADEYGNAVALNGRDCSVQRRHQKIIEEGPPVAASPHVWTEMEKAAVSLAKAVGYANAGTVEYLYSEPDSKFYFLELNPRLQVEHPVTEMITRVNLPAAQLQVAMGIPLNNIPEIRELYGRNRFENDPLSSCAKIDFDSAEQVPTDGHCIAVRITAENAEAGFKPTSGGIQELNFRSTPSVWGYFSMDSSGSIHEFADSQFGHLFANGSDREQARRNMVLALKELSIRGDISTTVDYISKLIELDDYINNTIDTGWLDELIKSNVDGMGVASDSMTKGQAEVEELHQHTYVVMGATIIAYNACAEGEKKFVESLEKGQLPSNSLLTMIHDVELILSGTKYKLQCTRNGPTTFTVSVAGDEEHFVTTNVRLLSDGGYLIDIGGKSHVGYVTVKGDAATGMRLNVGGANVAFSPDYDPSSLRTDVAGKLVKKLVPDGARLKKGEPYCEIEVMKMFMPLKVEETGVITWCSNEGASISAGDLLASLTLENPENVAAVTVFQGGLRVRGWQAVHNNKSSSSSTSLNHVMGRPHLLFRSATEKLAGGMSGYVLSDAELKSAMKNLETAAMDRLLPVWEIDEQLSVLSGRIPQPLFENVSGMINEFKKACSESQTSGMELRFPAYRITEMLSEHENAIQDSSERSTFSTLVGPLRSAVLPYEKSHAVGVPGSERAALSFLEILRAWASTEMWFCDGKSHADSIEMLRKANKGDYENVLKICRAHARVQSTCAIVLHIIGLISDGFKVSPLTSITSPIGKRVSILTGAESLSDMLPCLAEIGAMGGNDVYSEVAFRARKLVLMESMPALEDRKDKVWEAAQKLASAEAPQSTLMAKGFLAERLPLFDALFPLLETHPGQKEEMALLELYARDLYRVYTVKDVSKNFETRSFTFSFLARPAENAISITRKSLSSLTELTALVQGSESFESEGNLVSLDDKERMPADTQRTGVCMIVDTIADLENPERVKSVLSSFPQFPRAAPRCDAGPINVLYIVVVDEKVLESHMDEMAEKCRAALSTHRNLLDQADIRRVSFSVNRDSTEEFRLPAIFTFSHHRDFAEDALFRNIEPSHAFHLDLSRIATNFAMRNLGCRHTTNCLVHMYEATPKLSALSKDRQANKAPRVFVRAVSIAIDFSSSVFERILVDALNALDLSSLKCKSDNHLYINLVNDIGESVADPVVVEQVVADILKRHGERISALGLVEVETRILCCLSLGGPPIALRLVASNPTGYVQVMNTYVEAADETSKDIVFKSIGGTKASLAGTGDSSWENLGVNTPYPLTRPFDAQRKAALKASDTLYCYDLPALFEAAIEQQWSMSTVKGDERRFAMIGSPEQTQPRALSSRPLMVMYTTELVVQKKGNLSSSGSWTMKDYLDGNLELVQMNRGAGANDVGMVAWLMVLKTVEYPEGRQVVLIANDITRKAGSFGTREDVVFKLASEFAREKRIPRLFVAANSGARIGLADGVKQAYKVAFKDPSKPENGFDFLYVTEEDYAELGSRKKELKAELVSLEGKDVYRLTDIIGSEPDLGVENLKGSGLIAGETSAAYEDIFTMTIVLGRTVGIGAYLVRLGQRTIQKSSGSPIILTGYQALNKLMGVNVYQTNDQLGGPGIMYSNGISHLVAPDHLNAVNAAIDWLSYVPSVRRGLLPILDIRGVDVVERTVDFMPSPGVPYDPRLLLEGKQTDEGGWLSGFFDRGSFKEYLAGWAKTVIIGRARLGGIPMGVVVTENRSAEAIKPADPADVKASEAVVQEAGCVWFPNSAYKTAQAINDFRTEDLPLIVFANWRGFSGGQRDMFDEVLKYGSLIVDAFVAYEQPVFVFIPPFAEIRGGAWVVLDASINASVMEMYASAGSARGGVLEANGAASVKYRAKDLVKTMHRLDDQLQRLDAKLEQEDKEALEEIKSQIANRERALLPVYEQISVQFCELHDTPGRMKAVGVIEREVEWKHARSFFYWRLRRKLAEFDLRSKLIEAAEVGRALKAPTPIEASNMIRGWFLETPGNSEELWADDKAVLSWMARQNDALELKVASFTKHCVTQEVYQAMTQGGNTARIGTEGIVEGISRAYAEMDVAEKKRLKQMLREALQL